MPNKTIASIIATVIIVICNMFTLQEATITYTGMAVIAALGGVSIYRNSHPPK